MSKLPTGFSWLPGEGASSSLGLAEDRGATKRKLQNTNDPYITKHKSGFRCTRIQRRRTIHRILISLNTEVLNKA